MRPARPLCALIAVLLLAAPAAGQAPRLTEPELVVRVRLEGPDPAASWVVFPFGKAKAVADPDGKSILLSGAPGAYEVVAFVVDERRQTATLKVSVTLPGPVVPPGPDPDPPTPPPGPVDPTPPPGPSVPDTLGFIAAVRPAVAGLPDAELKRVRDVYAATLAKTGAGVYADYDAMMADNRGRMQTALAGDVAGQARLAPLYSAIKERFKATWISGQVKTPADARQAWAEIVEGLRR